MLSCPECNENITLLLWPWFRPYVGDLKQLVGKVIISCPECDTKLTLPDNCITKKKDGRIEGITIVKTEQLASRLTPMNQPGVYRENISCGMATQEELDNELNKMGKAQCFTCHNHYSLFDTYLVKLRTTYFPKLVEVVMMRASDGILYNEERIKYLPPIPIKTRLCKTCFNTFPVSSYAKDESGTADIEVCPDPKNMMRDGLRNIPLSHTPKFEKEIVEQVIDINDYGCYREDIEIKGIHIYDRVEDRRLRFSSNLPDAPLYSGPERRKTPRSSIETFIMKDSPEGAIKVYPERRRDKLRLTVQCHYSRQSKHRDTSESEIVGFHKTNIERRDAFKRWFEKTT